MIRTTDPGKVISCIWILCVVLGTSALVRAEHLPIKIYTTADGLWSSSISYLMRDSHGFIWFCTREAVRVTHKIADRTAPQAVSGCEAVRSAILCVTRTASFGSAPVTGLAASTAIASRITNSVAIRLSPMSLTFLRLAKAFTGYSQTTDSSIVSILGPWGLWRHIAQTTMAGS